MVEQKKSPSGDGSTGLGEMEQNSTVIADRHCYDTTKLGPVQQLMTQAEERMERDPARYGKHSQIWLSLHCLKTGQPWPGKVG